jgi:hypothetical protein
VRIDPDLPGADLVEKGLRDLKVGRTTAAGLLVLIGRPRLAWLGIEVPESDVPDPESVLYDLLEAQDARDAHSRYNALIRRLVSFERALEGQVFREERRRARMA